MKNKSSIWKFAAILSVFLLSACAASRVQLPMNLAEQIQTSEHKLNKSDSNLFIAMSEDDAGLRYLASVHDLKLQLDIGTAYKKNLLDVMNLMFAESGHINSFKDLKSVKHSKNTYVLDVEFDLTRVILPRTRFGDTEAHMVISYTMLNSKGKKLFTYTDYASGSKSNLSTLSNAAVFVAFPLFGAFMQSEKGIVGSAMEYNMKSSIIKITDIIQKYMDAKERGDILKTIAANEKALADSSKQYRARIENGNLKDKRTAIRELKTNYPALARTQVNIAKELIKMAGKELKDPGTAAAAKEMCAILSTTGNAEYLQTFQKLIADARDKRLRSWSKSYHEVLLKSLCGTSHCLENKAPAG